MLNRARILTDVGLVCSIKTLKELRDEQLATALIQIIGLVALSADQFCDQVSVGISGALTPLYSMIFDCHTSWQGSGILYY